MMLTSAQVAPVTNLALDDLESRLSSGGTGGNLGEALVTHGIGEQAEVCFTAPHAVEHWRHGRWKYAEPYTGALALWCASALGGAGVVVSQRLRSDANWDATHPLKDWVASLAPGAVVDMHMMRDSHGPDVCVGLGPRGERDGGLGEHLVEALRRAGFTCSVNVPFAALGPGTVTAHAQHGGADAVQLEFAARTLLSTVRSRHAVADAVISGVRSYLCCGGGRGE